MDTRKHHRGKKHPEGVRLSIGLEDWHDIIRDLELTLEKV
jgi:O-acetylhomoserine/O-acetylserine sulfhydrylase-like pyridoxal-dependent enzyme